MSNDPKRECNNTDASEIDKEKNERLCQIEELMKRVEAFEIEKSTHLSQIDDLKDTLQNEVDHRKTLENKLEAKEENNGLIETRVSDENVNRQIQTHDELRQENDHLNEVINKLRQDLNNLNLSKIKPWTKV
jgi:chromosome segregation ATPase